MPSRVGNYRLGRTLGRGSFGKVYIGTHEPTHKRVAIKILNRNSVLQMESETKVEGEIRILSSLNHPHIIKLYEVIVEYDIFVIMEYVPNGELFDYIVKNGKLNENEARLFFQQLISGIEYCHFKGIIHRDLKPENLLLDENNNLRIADFGLSNIRTDGYFLKTSCGSPNYAAPEVIQDKLYVGPEIDVWSCGVILYALLCGQLPFDDDNIPNLFKKINSGNYRIPAFLPLGAKELIISMLQINPLKRIKIKQIKKHYWFKKYLPDYLKMKPYKLIKKEKILDSSILKVLENNIGFKKSEIINGLKYEKKYKQLMYKQLNKQNKLKIDRRLKDIIVCYELLHDQVHRNEISKMNRYLYNNPKYVNNSNINDNISNYNKNKHFNSNQNNRKHQNKIKIGLDGSVNPNEMSQSFTQNKWTIGLSTNTHPKIWIQHILESLKSLNMEWLIQSNYCIIAKQVTPINSIKQDKNNNNNISNNYDTESDDSDSEYDENDNENNEITTTQIDNCRIKLQLYSQKSNYQMLYNNKYEYNYSHYRLDVQRLQGGTFPFLDLCSKLMANSKHLPIKNHTSNIYLKNKKNNKF